MIPDDVIVDAISKARRMPEFDESAWLTFYLSAPPENLETISSLLGQIGGQNLDGSEGGFLYAKLPTKLELDDVRQRAEQVSELAQQCDVSIALIDLDSSCEVIRSKFLNLFQRAA